MSEEIRVQNAPKEIHLIVGDLDNDTTDFKDLVEVSWADEKIYSHDIPYIRADLVPKWNKVDDGTPNEGVLIELAIVGQHSKEVIQGIYEFGTWYDADNYSLGSDFTVTHWRPRPEYPTEGI